MKIVKIPKGNGNYRTIYVPNKVEKKELQDLLPTLASAERKLAQLYNVGNVAHGFIKGRSPVTAAFCHVGDYAVTISVDLRSWFDSVDIHQIKDGLQYAEVGNINEVIKKICVDGHPRQGLPTSPTAANIAAVQFDRILSDKLSQWTCVYTRYADDITISLHDDNRAIINLIIASIQICASQMNWSIATNKTKVYLAKGGYRSVLGIAVNDNGIVPTRQSKRKLRAALHQNNPHSVRGLEEWMKLKKPKNEVITQSLLEYYTSLVTERCRIDGEGKFLN